MTSQRVDRGAWKASVRARRICFLGHKGSRRHADLPVVCASGISEGKPRGFARLEIVEGDSLRGCGTCWLSP